VVGHFLLLAHRDVGQHEADVDRGRHGCRTGLENSIAIDDIEWIAARIGNLERHQRLQITGDFKRDQFEFEARPEKEKHVVRQVILGIGLGEACAARIITLGGYRKTDAQQEDQTGGKPEIKPVLHYVVLHLH
jgi:hypothetical protein